MCVSEFSNFFQCPLWISKFKDLHARVCVCLCTRRLYGTVFIRPVLSGVMIRLFSNRLGPHYSGCVLNQWSLAQLVMGPGNFFPIRLTKLIHSCANERRQICSRSHQPAEKRNSKSRKDTKIRWVTVFVEGAEVPFTPVFPAWFVKVEVINSSVLSHCCRWTCVQTC